MFKNQKRKGISIGIAFSFILLIVFANANLGLSVGSIYALTYVSHTDNLHSLVEDSSSTNGYVAKFNLVNGTSNSPVINWNLIDNAQIPNSYSYNSFAQQIRINKTFDLNNYAAEKIVYTTSFDYQSSSYHVLTLTLEIDVDPYLPPLTGYAFDIPYTIKWDSSAPNIGTIHLDNFITTSSIDVNIMGIVGYANANSPAGIYFKFMFFANGTYYNPSIPMNSFSYSAPASGDVHNFNTDFDKPVSIEYYQSAVPFGNTFTSSFFSSYSSLSNLYVYAGAAGIGVQYVSGLQKERSFQIAGTGYITGFIYPPSLDSDFANPIPPPPPPKPNSPPPSAPTGTFWVYTTFNLTVDHLEIVIPFTDNATYNYTYAIYRVDSISANFYYTVTVIPYFAIPCVSWGDWTFAFNFLRDGLATILNGLLWILNEILLLCQFLLFILWVIVQFLLWLVYIIGAFLWNVPIFWVIFAGFWVLIFLWLLLNYLYFNVIVPFLTWLWNDIILPVLTWIVDNGIPAIITLLLFVLAIILTSLIWLLSFGSINFVATLNNVIAMDTYISNYFVTFWVSFMQVLPSALLYIVSFIVIFGFTYVTWIVAKARGFKHYAESLEISFNVYVQFIELIRKLIMKIKELLTGWL